MEPHSPRSKSSLPPVFAINRVSAMVYDEWMPKTKPAPGPDGLRRPLWMNRPLHPVADAYKMG